MSKKLIVILGPTASGKSDLAVKLAKKFNGEVVSADSRQVYRGMNLGTGKITKKEMQGVAHYLLDVARPKRRFTVAQYQKFAFLMISKIFKKEKIPILCGGTGFYIQSVVDGIVIPRVPPNWKLRKKLEKKDPKQLYKMLKKLDPARAKTIEKKNPRRLIRALEIVIKTKKPVPSFKKNPPQYPVLILGIKKSTQELALRIKSRLKKRLRRGMIAEVKKLRKFGLSWRKLEDFGLEYRWIARYLQKKISRGEMIERLQKDIEHFSKRQMTWFRRDQRIFWIKSYRQAEFLVSKFLKSR
ncbi:MAG: tRNA (adenosine(37)-N6)-dimethylallyltransferase MiaA [Patescibacteria group bacterium]